MTLAHPHQTYPVFSYPEVRHVRDGNTVFSAVAAWNVNNFGLEANGATRPVWGWQVSGQYFEVLAIKPLLGRLLTARRRRSSRILRGRGAYLDRLEELFWFGS